MSQIRRASARPRAVSPGELPARKADRTRLAILDAALALLWSRPFRDLTVSDVMAEAGASRPAFYQYFRDLHELMEELLRDMGEEIFQVAESWFRGEGDPVAALHAGLREVVRVGYERGPNFRAIVDAATTDERFEKVWSTFMKQFDDAVCDRIEAQQAKGLVPMFEARPMAVALNRLDVSMLTHAFGRRPRGDPDAVHRVLFRIWSSALYPEAKLGDVERRK